MDSTHAHPQAPQAGDIATTLIGQFPICQELAEALAVVIARDITATKEAQMAWDKVGKMADDLARLQRQNDVQAERIDHYREVGEGFGRKLAAIREYADILARGSGAVPAVDVAWKLRRILDDSDGA